MSKVWLITGSGNGLGRDVAEVALAVGDSVVAGARRTALLRKKWRFQKNVLCIRSFFWQRNFHSSRVNHVLDSVPSIHPANTKFCGY
jgi:NAD(P)-dependent dehydrogenase (short-subunit alcohol dehydrogenase family)